MKALIKYSIFTLPILLVVIAACKKTPDPVFHFEYFGLQEGRYVIYDAIEVTHDSESGIHDTVEFQLKTVWKDAYIDNEGRHGREYHRFVRIDAANPWVLKDVWYGLIDGIRAELVEENERIVKLVFSPTLEKEWDANAYNLDDPLDCNYSDIHDPMTVGGVSFDSTLIVEQEEYFTLLDTVRKYEVYAKGVGLIKKYERDDFYQFGSPEVVLGNDVYYTFVSTGIE